MSWQHQAKTQDGDNSTVRINNVPDECPQCHTKGTFSPLVLHLNNRATDEKKLEVVFRCPNARCYKTFIGYYGRHQSGHYNLKSSKPREYNQKKFSETIEAISLDFSEIYNQALKAEDDNLDKICGPGYRKALEYLVKDYLTSNIEGGEKEEIKKETLGNSIANRITDTNIKEVAKRAVWLGNDETHYIRKWEEKELQDLKSLIDLTVHWIEAEALTKKLLEDMPDGGR